MGTLRVRCIMIFRATLLTSIFCTLHAIEEGSGTYVDHDVLELLTKCQSSTANYESLIYTNIQQRDQITAFTNALTNGLQVQIDAMKANFESAIKILEQKNNNLEQENKTLKEKLQAAELTGSSNFEKISAIIRQQNSIRS